MPGEFVGPYRYPRTYVLWNKPGIRDEGALRAFEYKQTTLRIEELRERPIAGKVDLDHLNRILGHVFQDVYEWDGQVRTVPIGEGSTRVAAPSFIEGKAQRLSES
jgi:cell filamentation protein